MTSPIRKMVEVTSPRKEKVDPQNSELVNFVGLEHVEGHTGRLLNKTLLASVRSAATRVYAGDVIYSRLRPYLNKVHLSDSDYAASAEFIVFPPNPGLSQKYLQFALMSPEFLKFAAIIDSGDRPRVNWDGIKNFEFPVPPLGQQHEIVERIEAALARIQDCRSELDWSRRRLTDLRRKFYAELFEGGPSLATLNSSDGKIRTTLGQIAYWGSGGTPRTTVSTYYEGDIPWAVIGDLTESIVIQTEKSISEEAVKQSSAKIFPKGSVMVAMYGASIGRTGIAGIDMATNQAIAVARTRPDLVREDYLLYFLQSQKESFVDAGQGGAQPNISQQVIKAWAIGLPPLDEQLRVVQLLDSYFANIDNAIETLRQLTSQSANLEAAVLNNLLIQNSREEI